METGWADSVWWQISEKSWSSKHLDPGRTYELALSWSSPCSTSHAPLPAHLSFSQARWPPKLLPMILSLQFNMPQMSINPSFEVNMSHFCFALAAGWFRPAAHLIALLQRVALARGWDACDTASCVMWWIRVTGSPWPSTSVTGGLMSPGLQWGDGSEGYETCQNEPCIRPGLGLRVSCVKLDC